MRTVIFAAGPIEDYSRIREQIASPDLVICADGGLRHALVLGYTPDLALGDFDSAGVQIVREIQDQGIPVKVVPAEKDQTDTHLALEEAVARGASEVLLVGATGGRLDHTLANLLLLPGLSPRVSVTMVDSKNILKMVRGGGRLTLAGSPGDLISLLPLSPKVEGVVAEGLKWPLDGATLRWGESLGVSNQFADREAFIAVRDGHLLVIQSWD